jgi:hypothetical protein
MSYIGIDYGLGQSNTDTANGIRYGVISQGSIMPEALDDMKLDYGNPTCPKCGEDVGEDYACIPCKETFESEEVFPEEALGFSYEKEGYKLSDCLDFDIFILKSPFYTHAQFCSPCVPGAGNLDNPIANGPKTYALGQSRSARHPKFKRKRTDAP